MRRSTHANMRVTSLVRNSVDVAQCDQGERPLK